MPDAGLSQRIKDMAAEVGFDRCGIARAEPIGRVGYLRTWLAGGRAGSMEYLHRHFRQRADPRELVSGAKSVVVAALSYHQLEPGGIESRVRPRGRIAMYAWGADYHEVVRGKLQTMAERLQSELDDPFGYRVFVDTAPLLEREVAAAAGIGWIGKNTMVLDHRLGSFFVLGEMVTTLDMAPDTPVEDHCGTCTACLDACPTDAFPTPYEMDASRCISYLTIERRDEVPAELQPKMDDWVFGCDVCQEVCPYNRDAPVTREPRFAIRSPGPRPELDDVLSWSAEDYRKKLRGSAMKRAKLDMWQRNARIARDNRARASTQRQARQ